MVAPSLRPHLALGFCAALLSGCAVLPRPQPAAHPAEITATAPELRARLELRRAQLQNMQALTRMRYSDPRENSSSRQAIIVARPGRVRVEVLTLMGTAFLLATDGESLQAYQPGHKTVYRGSASPENLWRYTRLRMPVHELVDLILATPSLEPGGRDTVRHNGETGEIELLQSLEGEETLVRFSEELLPVAFERHVDGEQPAWRARFREYEHRGGTDVATRIDVEVPESASTIQLALSDIETNVTLDTGVFLLQTPAGDRIVDLDLEEN